MFSKRAIPVLSSPRFPIRLNSKGRTRTIKQSLKHGHKKILSLASDGTVESISVVHPLYFEKGHIFEEDFKNIRQDNTWWRNTHSALSVLFLHLHPIQRSLFHFRQAFLPVGYPHSVGKNYGKYITWQAIHHMTSAVNGVIASTFLLYGVGLGQNEAVATAGAINWVLKDGFGQLGTLYFGKKIAPLFDAHPKTWYMAASIMLDVAVGLEISTFMWSSHFLVIGSLANMLKGLSWMASGSTRSVFNVSFTKDKKGDNIGDLTAKFTSQTICTSLIGTSLGIGLASTIGQSTSLSLSLYALISSIHLYGGYRSARCIPLSSLNPTRLQLLLDKYLNNQAQQPTLPSLHSIENLTATHNPKALSCNCFPRPEDLAKEDPVFYVSFFNQDPRFVPHITIGVDLYADLARGSDQQLGVLLDVFEKEDYMISVCPYTGGVMMVIREEAGCRGCFKGYLQAIMLRRLIHQDQLELITGSHVNFKDILLATKEEAEKSVDVISNKMIQSGWQVDKVLLEEDCRRASW